MRIVFIILLLVLKANFALSQLDGYYQVGNKYGEPGSSSLCFNKLGSFLYSVVYDIGPTRVEVDGHYTVHEDTLMLNSYYQPEDYINITQSTIINSDSLIVVVNTVSGEVPFLCEMLINDSIRYSNLPKNDNGAFKLPKNFVKSISFHTAYSQWNTLKLKKTVNAETTLLVVIIDDTIGYYRCYIKNEKFIIRKNKLVEITSEHQRVFQKRLDLKKCMN